MTKKVLDIYYGNVFDADKEKASGTDGVIIKGGQGQYAEYFAKGCKYIDECKRVGLPWGIYWVVDARYSTESQKAALKSAFPDGNFGPLGLWLDVEKPAINMTEADYRKLPYAYYKPIESIAQSMILHSKTGVGIYTSWGQWDLCAGVVPSVKLDFFATLPLWTAQYGVTTPKMYGHWKNYVMWQDREGPDYSVTDEAWFASKVSATPVPTPVPVPTTIKSITINIKSDKAELISVQADSSDVTNISHLVVTPYPVTPPPTTTPIYWVALHDSEPRNNPETFKCYNDIKFTVTSQLEAYWKAVLHLLNPSMSDADFLQNWHNITGSEKAFTNGTGWESDKFAIEALYCGGFTMRATTGVTQTIGGNVWLEVHTLDPNNLPPTPTSLSQVDRTLHFIPVISTGGDGTNHKANAFPAFDGRCAVPFLGTGGKTLIQVTNAGIKKAVKVSEVLNPFDPERPDLVW